VNYSLGDFKHNGTFYAVWNKIFDDTCKYRDDFGNKLHQAVVSLHNFQKMTIIVPLL
jgi:phage-related protein